LLQHEDLRLDAIGNAVSTELILTVGPVLGASPGINGSFGGVVLQVHFYAPFIVLAESQHFLRCFYYTRKRLDLQAFHSICCRFPQLFRR
jgi:hypothetical protein